MPLSKEDVKDSTGITCQSYKEKIQYVLFSGLLKKSRIPRYKNYVKVTSVERYIITKLNSVFLKIKNYEH